MPQILVIEDDHRIRDNIVDLLEIDGYEVVAAADGAAGLARAMEHLPDLILCDVMMPQMNGHEVLHALRQVRETEAIPFLFLTARIEKQDVRQGMNLGADDYLTKPFTHAELRDAIQTRLTKQNRVQQRHEAELNELRDHVAQVIPHEMRTALAGMLGFTQLLRQEWPELEAPTIYEMLDLIEDGGKRLERLAENFGLYTQLHILNSDTELFAAFQQQRARTDVATAAAVADRVAARWERTDALHCALAPGAVRLRESHFAKLVEELVDNACKFSEAGTSVKVLGKPSRRSYHLRVVDEGRGMPRGFVQHLGGAFRQYERSYYEQQGLGLGLALVHRLLALYDGKLYVDSQPGRGTMIQVTLPLV